ncbi:unnamed protein product, partial [Phyllotreta striolata]
MGLCRCLFRSFIFTIITVAVIVLVPNLPPYAKISKSVSIPKITPLDGPFTINEKLKGIEQWQKGKVNGPEAFAEYNGELYASLYPGVVAKQVNEQFVMVAKTGKSCKNSYDEHICGRPLGIRFDKNGYLYVADAYYGILRFDLKKNEKITIVSPNEEIGGAKPMLFNSLDLASNGDIFWSDSSSQFHLNDLTFDSLADASGRLIRYNANTKKNEVLIDNLRFANGVKLSQDEDFVLVGETMYNRVHRYYLKGPKKGTHDIFIEGLPGLVDNIQSDGGDGFILPLVETVTDDHPSFVHVLLEFPTARKFIARLMGLGELAIETVDKYYPTDYAKSAVHFIGHYRSVSFLGKSSPFQMIVHVNKAGDVIETFSTTDKQFRGYSDAFIFKNQMYLGSPHNDYIGRIPLSKLGWSESKVKRSVPEPKAEAKQAYKTETKPTTTTPPPSKPTTTPPPPKTTPKPQTTAAPKTTQAPKPTVPPTKPSQKPTTAPPKQQTQTPPSTKPTTPSAKSSTSPPAKSTTTPPPKSTTTAPP